MHILVPPRAGPGAASSLFEGNVGLVFLLGLVVALPTWFFVGHLYGKYVGHRFNIIIPDILTGTEGKQHDFASKLSRGTVVTLLLLPLILIFMNTGLNTMALAGLARHAVSRAGTNGMDIGALAVAVLKRAGAAEIIAIDMFDKALEIAAGATSALTADDVESIAAIEASGNHRGLASAMRGTVRGGRIVMVGLLPSGEQPALISLSITRELGLVESFRFNDEIDDVLDALADGTLDVLAIVTHEFDVKDALGASVTAKNAAESGKVLLKF